MNRVSFALRGTGRGSLTGRGFTPDLVTGHGSQSVTGADHPDLHRNANRCASPTDAFHRGIGALQPNEVGLYDAANTEDGRSLNLIHIRRLRPVDSPIPVQGYTAGLRYSLAHRPVGGRTCGLNSLLNIPRTRAPRRLLAKQRCVRARPVCPLLIEAPCWQPVAPGLENT
jgi:hypothetical protein